MTGMANASTACLPCPAGRWSNATGADTLSLCHLCPAYELSPPGSMTCSPGVITVLASDPDPIFPGLSLDDEVRVCRVCVCVFLVLAHTRLPHFAARGGLAWGKWSQLRSHAGAGFGCTGRASPVGEFSVFGWTLCTSDPVLPLALTISFSSRPCLHPPPLSHSHAHSLSIVLCGTPPPTHPPQITIYFTQRTNRPDVSSTVAVLDLVNMTVSPSSVLRATWKSGGDADVPNAQDRLVVRLARGS
jgi:hypothetical protein